MATAVVTCFLRNEAAVLLLRRGETGGPGRGLWDGVTGHAEDSPDRAARRVVHERTGLDATDLAFVRAGDPLEVSDEDGEWLIHPYLFDCRTRAVEPAREPEAREWVSPTAILRRETVTGLWASYDRVRPGVATVAGDTEHGSAALSVRALETLRDEAALCAESTDRERSNGRPVAGWPRLTGLARELATARTAMPVIATRVDRAVHEADERTPIALEAAAAAGIERALRADERAAASAAERVGDRVATLSRSGTVQAALGLATPDAVLVAESHPGREGVGAAEVAAETLEATVTLTTDAAFPHQLVEWGADALLVGADAVLPDGRVVNKAGTRGAALSAARTGVDVVVAASADKVRRRAAVEREPRGPGEVREGGDGRPELDIRNPTFDVTPAGVVTVVGEDGAFDPAAVVATHRRRAAWRRGDSATEVDGR